MKMQEAMISPAKEAIHATITVPGSKSFTNRALILAALAQGVTELKGILKSDDSHWCMESLNKLGIQVEVEGDMAKVHGAGGVWPVQEGDLYLGASGTVSRFLPGAIAIGQGIWKLNGSKRLQERPMAPLLDALIGLGAEVSFADNQGCLPLTLKANGLKGGEASVAGSVSSQFISGLLLAAPYMQEGLNLKIEGEVVQREYVEMTIEMMRSFGIQPQVLHEGQTIQISPGVYEAQSLQLEPDISTCCYFWALSALTNGRIRINGVSMKTRQPDIGMINMLERMGCGINQGDGFIEVIGTRQLKGGFTTSMQSWSDQTLTMAVLAVFADAPITLTDAEHIRHHECDRITAICTELRKLGIQVEEFPDGLTVFPGLPNPVLLETYEDHRMAMALALIGSRVAGIRIADPGCVSKTCPDFFERLSALHLQVDYS